MNTSKLRLDAHKQTTSGYKSTCSNKDTTKLLVDAVQHLAAKTQINYDWMQVNIYHHKHK